MALHSGYLIPEVVFVVPRLQYQVGSVCLSHGSVLLLVATWNCEKKISLLTVTGIEGQGYGDIASLGSIRCWPGTKLNSLLENLHPRVKCNLPCREGGLGSHLHLALE